MGPLLRLGVWGACAIIAVGAARLAARSEVGAARTSAALAALRTSPIDLLDPGAAQARRAEAEVNDLADTVRTITDDRDRLAARVATLERSLAGRVATLERNLTDLTGSIARERAAALSANPPGSGEPAAASSSPVPPTQEASANAWPTAPLKGAAANDDARPAEAIIGTIVTNPQPRSGPLAAIQSYVSAASTSQPTTRLAEAPAGTAAADAPRGIALELAIATNVNALRARWGTLKFQHPGLLDGLKPRVSVRPSARPGFTEFHLVAGPVSSNDVAVRLCGALAAAHIPCRPAPYDGQSLELR